MRQTAVSVHRLYHKITRVSVGIGINSKACGGDGKLIHCFAKERTACGSVGREFDSTVGTDFCVVCVLELDGFIVHWRGFSCREIEKERAAPSRDQHSSVTAKCNGSNTNFLGIGAKGFSFGIVGADLVFDSVDEIEKPFTLVFLQSALRTRRQSLPQGQHRCEILQRHVGRD